MKKIYATLLVGSFVHVASAQCNSAIPANAMISVGEQSLTANDQHYWVCDGTLNLIGNGNTLWVEENATASVTGTNNTIHSKSIVLSQSEDGNGSNIIYVQVLDHALSTNSLDQIVNCPEVTFDLTDAPAPSCAEGTSIEELETLVQLEAFPNPMVNELSLTVDEGTRMERVRIIDLRGSVVLDIMGQRSMRIDVSALSPGLYTVLVGTDRGQLVRKIRKDG